MLSLTLLSVPFAFFGAGMAVQSNVNKVEDWLPKTFVETTELAWFRKNFPTDQFIVVSWQGCVLGDDPRSPNAAGDDPRIKQLCSILVPPKESAIDDDVRDAREYIKSVTTGRELIDQLTSPPSSFDYSQAIQRVTGSLVGNDGKQTCVVVSLKPEASKNLKAVLGRGKFRLFRPNIPPGIVRRAIEKCGISEADVHLGGPPVDNVAIDEEGEKTLVRLAGAAALVGIVLAWFSLRSILLTSIVFFCGIVSAAFSLAIIWATGETVDAIVLSMPALVYVLAISESVHFINYYRDAVIEGGIEGASERAVQHSFKPALLCSVTTAFGLISLYASDLVPIRKFGLYASIGVMIILAVLFLLLPTFLHVARFGRLWLDRPSSHEDNTHADGPIERVWRTMGSWIVQHHFAVSSVCLLVTGLIGYGLTKTKTSIDLLELFDSRAKILQDYRWLEKNIGRLVPLEIVVRFDPKSLSTGSRTNDSSATDLFRLTFLERMETTIAIQAAIEKEFGVSGKDIVGRSLSAADFIPSFPSTSGDTLSFIQRSAYEARLASTRDSLISSGYLRMDARDGSELWRISLRVAAFQGVDYGQFVHELRAKVEPLMQAHLHRVRILEQIASWSTEQRYAGSKVYLWERAPIEPTGSHEQQTQNTTMVDALEALLKTARIKVIRGEATPQSIPIVSLQQLNQLDAVVLVGDFPTGDLQTIQWALSKVIDLTGPALTSSVPSTTSATDPKEISRNDHPWLSAVYTGVVPIVYKAQRALLQSLVESTFWSFITISPLMMFVCRGVRAGAVSMIPNILPVICIFGAMGWLGIPIDIGSMMSASIALGVAVDDTIHFLAWFRNDLDRLGDRKKAIVAAYQSCATPTLQSALISGLGLSVFAFSTFTPTQRFGWLMLTILVAGVVAELVMLPAILAGPLGSVFEPPKHDKRTWKHWWLKVIRRDKALISAQSHVIGVLRRAA